MIESRRLVYGMWWNVRMGPGVPLGSERHSDEVKLAVILEKLTVHVEQTDVLNVIGAYSVIDDWLIFPLSGGYSTCPKVSG